MKIKYFLIGLIALTLPLAAAAGKGKDNVFTGSWKSSNDGSVALLPEGREGACMGRVDEMLVMTHGFAAGTGDSGDVRIYNTVTDTWFSGTSSPNARSEGVGVSYQGFVYCIGGRVQTLVERYMLAGDSWSTMAPMGVARGGPAAAVYEYKTGLFDPVTGAEIIAPLIYVFGGRDGSSPFSGTVLDSAEVYDIGTDTWFGITPPPTPVSDARAVTKGGHIYLIGGAVMDGFTQVSSPILQIYDPQTDTWEAGPDMFSARANHAVAYIGDTIYVIGGALINGGFNERLVSVEAYDVDKMEWTEGLADKPNGSNETHAVRIGNKLYVPGSGLFGSAWDFFDVFSRK